MRANLVLASAAVFGGLSAAPASAAEQMTVTPPILRDRAFVAHPAHPARELTVIPQPVNARPVDDAVTVTGSVTSDGSQR